MSSPPLADSAQTFTEIRAIGKGSFGKVTLVRDGLGRLCVKKTVDIGLLDEHEQKVATAEVSLLASLKHPYIIRYFQSFVDGRILNIIMEYAQGGDLHKRVRDTKTSGKLLGEPQVRRWLTQTVLGLKYLHSRNILHKDLKPHNLFLTKQDNVRIGDFGISQVLGLNGRSSKIDNKEDRRIEGTPSYLSPEVCTEAAYSFASDMWALGCILYELCALQVAFDASTAAQLVRRITHAPPPALPGSFSAELKVLCSRLLSRDQTQRPSAVEVIQGGLVQCEISRMLAEEKGSGWRPTDDARPESGTDSQHGGSGMAAAQASLESAQRVGPPRLNDARPTIPAALQSPCRAGIRGALRHSGSAALLTGKRPGRLSPSKGASGAFLFARSSSGTRVERVPREQAQTVACLPAAPSALGFK